MHCFLRNIYISFLHPLHFFRCTFLPLRFILICSLAVYLSALLSVLFVLHRRLPLLFIVVIFVVVSAELSLFFFSFISVFFMSVPNSRVTPCTEGRSRWWCRPRNCCWWRFNAVDITGRKEQVVERSPREGQVLPSISETFVRFAWYRKKKTTV